MVHLIIVELQSKFLKVWQHTYTLISDTRANRSYLGSFLVLEYFGWKLTSCQVHMRGFKLTFCENEQLLKYLCYSMSVI